ncbi:MAG: 4'-phosphopantetheinyl transferase superfamily protein [Sandaracinaceae bacterium]|nr:4'-phosphopantetheinyl transferase superfamily protein [Sandaracinaceae bacterium]
MPVRHRADLSALLSELLGAGVTFALREPGEVPVAALRPIEAEAVRSAVEPRRLEMAAGRDAAREALSRLGIEDATLPVAPGGAPAWPEGVVGSITHTRTLCIAAVARRSDLLAIGLDAESDEPLDAALWEIIGTEVELGELARLGGEEAGARARAMFCAKEAAYKCQYTVTGALLDFGDLRVEWPDPGGGDAGRGGSAVRRRVRARCAPLPGRGSHPGLVGRAGGHVIAVAALSPSRAARR